MICLILFKSRKGFNTKGSVGVTLFERPRKRYQKRVLCFFTIEKATLLCVLR